MNGPSDGLIRQQADFVSLKSSRLASVLGFALLFEEQGLLCLRMESLISRFDGQSLK